MSTSGEIERAPIIIESARIRMDRALAAYRALHRELYGDDEYQKELEEDLRISQEMRREEPKGYRRSKRLLTWGWFKGRT